MEWKYSEENPLRVFEAFAGYGSQAMALRNIGIPYRVVGIAEIDRYAIKAYMAVHGETRNWGDVTQMDWSEVEDFDLLTWSSPCQDFSNAGLQKGGEEGSGTRSSLLWRVKDAIAAKRPRYILFENVKGFVSGDNLATYKALYEYLSGEGYSVFAQVLNAKDYGVPQNRERCFIVAIQGDTWYNFPQPRELTVSLVDLLEKEVAEKYYLDQARVDRFISELPPEKLAMLEGL
jgi:DNA (cytosine-5)-methyltransferase 1